MILVKYSDDSETEYDSVEHAEIGVLEAFAGSDNDATPVSIDEYGDDGIFIQEYRCQWSVELLGDEDEG